MNSKQLHSTTYDLARIIRTEAGRLMEVCRMIQEDKDFSNATAIEKTATSIDQIEKAVSAYMTKILA